MNNEKIMQTWKNDSHVVCNRNLSDSYACSWVMYTFNRLCWRAVSARVFIVYSLSQNPTMCRSPCSGETPSRGSGSKALARLGQEGLKRQENSPRWWDRMKKNNIFFLAYCENYQSLTCSICSLRLYSTIIALQNCILFFGRTIPIQWKRRYTNIKGFPR